MLHEPLGISHLEDGLCLMELELVCEVLRRLYVKRGKKIDLREVERAFTRLVEAGVVPSREVLEKWLFDLHEKGIVKVRLEKNRIEVRYPEALAVVADALERACTTTCLDWFREVCNRAYSAIRNI